MPLSDPKHPLWSIIRMAVVMCGMALILNVTASNFDFGELSAAAGGGILTVAFDIIKRNVTSG